MGSIDGAEGGGGVCVWGVWFDAGSRGTCWLVGGTVEMAPCSGHFFHPSPIHSQNQPPPHRPPLHSTTGSPLKGKPHPAIFEAAKSKLVVGGEGVVLEDSVNGVIAGLRSGHKCIWVQDDQSITFEHLLDAIEALGIAHEIDCSRVWVYRAKSLNEIVSVIKALL